MSQIYLTNEVISTQESQIQSHVSSESGLSHVIYTRFTTTTMRSEVQHSVNELTKARSLFGLLCHEGIIQQLCG